jgi:hypothetical protein
MRTNSTFIGRIAQRIMNYGLKIILKEDELMPIGEFIWEIGFRLKYGNGSNKECY